MKRSQIKLLVIAVLMTLIIAAFPMTALAASSSDAVIGNSYTLESGQFLNNDLFVLGGSVNLKQGSTITGNVLMIGSTAQMAGTINGNVVVVGGTINLADTFILNDNLTYAGTAINRAPNAQINGQINANGTPPNVVLPYSVQIPFVHATANFGLRILGYLAGLFFWTLIAMLVAMFLPVHLSRVSHTILTQPLLSGGLGIVTIIILPIILVLLAITICLIPVSLLGAFVLAIAWAYGLISLGLEIGKRISTSSKHEWHPAISAGVGTLILMAIVNGLSSFVPCIGWIPKVLVGLVGLGAVILTQFGRNTYPQNLSQAGGSSSEIIPPTSATPITPANS